MSRRKKQNYEVEIKKGVRWLVTRVRPCWQGKQLSQRTVRARSQVELWREASRAEAEIIEQARLGSGVANDAPLEHAFDEFGNLVLADGLSKATRRNYRRWLDEWLALFTEALGPSATVRSITLQVIQTIVTTKLAPTLSSKTIEDKFNFLRRAFNFFHVMEWTSLAVLDGVERPKVHRVRRVERDDGSLGPFILRTQAVQSVLDGLAQAGAFKMLYMWIILLATGARRNAIVGLRRDRVDVKNQTVVFLEKGGKQRIIRLEGAAWQVVQFLLDRVPGPYLFAYPPKADLRQARESVYSKPPRYPSLQWEQVKDLVPSCRPFHDVRSFLLRHLVASGVQLDAIMRWMGWSSHSTLRHYLPAQEGDEWPDLTPLTKLEPARRRFLSKVLTIPTDGVPAFEGWTPEIEPEPLAAGNGLIPANLPQVVEVSPTWTPPLAANA